MLGRSAVEGEAAYERDLRARADVTIHLDPPRLAVDIPPGAPGTGPDDAPVTIVEFTDYQCPYCHRAQDVLDRVLEEYSGKVRLVHLDFPLGNHTGAIPAARAMMHEMIDSSDAWKLRLLLVPVRTLVEKAASGEDGK